MSLKVAISGKGGVGKTTFSAGLAFWLAAQGQRVWAVDADPDASLGTVLGIEDELLQKLKPIVDMKELINERMGGNGAFYPLNPDVDDVLDNYSIQKDNIRFLRMGNVKGGGTACYCRENSFLHAVVSTLILGETDTVLLDMGAGIEQLTRGTAAGVDLLIIVTEPGKTSIQSVQTIQQLALELGIPKTVVIGNKVRTEKEKKILTDSFGMNLVGVMPYSEDILESSVNGEYPALADTDTGQLMTQLFKKIIKEGRRG